MEQLALDLAAVRPYVRYAEEENIRRNKNDVFLCAYDHRLFYVVGGLLMAAAAVLLIAKKRMGKNA